MISTKPFPKLYYLLIYKDVKAFLDRLTRSLKRLMKYSFLTDMLLSISIFSSSSPVFIAHYPTSKNQDKEEPVCLKSVNKCFSLCLKNSIRKLTQLHGRKYLSKSLKLWMTFSIFGSLCLGRKDSQVSKDSPLQDS